MADPKVTKMVMDVDLNCTKCYRKIKKVLCRYPQIRNQEYDVKQNKVTITVVCCSPEKIKEKIACKAGKTVERIVIIPDKEVVKPSKPQPQPPPPPPPPPMVVCCCCCCYEGWPCYHGRCPMCYYECSGGKRCYCGSRCHEYFSDENAWGCTIM